MSKTWLLAIFAQSIIAIPSILLRGPSIGPNLPLNARLIAMTSRFSSLILVFFVISYIFRNAIVLRIAAVQEGSEIGFGSALRRGFKLLPRAILFLLLVTLVVAGVSGVAVLLGLALSTGVKASGAGQVGVLLAANAGVLVALALVLYFLIKLSLGFVIFVAADLPAMQSMRASWNLTRGNFWSTSIILSVLGIIGLVLALVVYLVVGAAAVMLGPTSPAAHILIQVASVVAYSFLGSLSPAMLLSIYQDRRLRQDGGDLAGRVSALATQ